MTFLIVAQRIDASNPWCKDEQVIDSTTELWWAKVLVKDYQVAWGPWYKVYYRKSFPT